MNPTPVDPIDECVRLSQEVELYKTLWKQRDGELMETLSDAVKIEDERNSLKRELARYQHMRPRTVLELSEANDKLNDELAETKRELTNYKLGFASQTEERMKLEAEVERLKADRDEWKRKHWKAHDDFHRAFLDTPEARAVLGATDPITKSVRAAWDSNGGLSKEAT